jgi:tetratricopeptide (TPR) repeat protein
MSAATAITVIGLMAVEGLPDRARAAAQPAHDVAEATLALSASRVHDDETQQEQLAPAAAPAAAPLPAAASALAEEATEATDDAEAERAAPPSKDPIPAPKPSDPALEKALAQAESLLGHRDLRALEAFRRLGEIYPEEPKVLEGWSRIAAATKWWGESLKVAERWAARDKSSHAHVHLARTQKRLGHVEKAIATLKALLSRSPGDAEAANLLQLYGGTPLALND